MSNIDIAIKHFGSQAALANVIGVNPMTVYQWKKRSIPPARAKQIAAASNGLIKPSDLRPDIFGDLDNENVS